MPRKAIFLDRDGVLNHSLVVDGKPYAPRRVEDFKLMADIGSLQRLRNLGYLLIVVTNQPDIGNGLVTQAQVDELHGILQRTFAFDATLTCPHRSDDDCECRKPKPGMLLQAKATYEIELAQSFMVGDRWRDILAGEAAGCRTVFIDHGYHEESPAFQPHFRCTSLAGAVDWIVKATAA